MKSGRRKNERQCGKRKGREEKEMREREDILRLQELFASVHIRSASRLPLLLLSLSSLLRGGRGTLDIEQVGDWHHLFLPPPPLRVFGVGGEGGGGGEEVRGVRGRRGLKIIGDINFVVGCE